MLMITSSLDLEWCKQENQGLIWISLVALDLTVLKLLKSLGWSCLASHTSILQLVKSCILWWFLYISQNKVRMLPGWAYYDSRILTVLFIKSDDTPGPHNLRAVNLLVLSHGYNAYGGRTAWIWGVILLVLYSFKSSLRDTAPQDKIPSHDSSTLHTGPDLLRND